MNIARITLAVVLLALASIDGHACSLARSYEPYSIL